MCSVSRAALPGVPVAQGRSPGAPRPVEHDARALATSLDVLPWAPIAKDGVLCPASSRQPAQGLRVCGWDVPNPAHLWTELPVFFPKLASLPACSGAVVP